MKTLFIFLLCFFADNPSRAQQVEAHPVKKDVSVTTQVLPQKLDVVERFPTKLEQNIVVTPAHCDENGNSYIRFYDANSIPNQAGKILKLSGCGEPLVSFSDQVTNYAPISFFVSSDGSIYDLASPVASDKKAVPDEAVLLVYDKDHGNLKKTIKLEPRISPFGSVAVFPSGEILISALEPLAAGEKKLPSAAFTALLDDSGKLLRRISPEFDSKIADAYEKNDEKLMGKSGGINRAVSQGAVVIGSDGYAYLLRRTVPAVIYVVSRFGEVVRTFSVAPDDPSLFPLSMLESNGQLAILFSKPGPAERQIKVVATRSGDVLQTINLESPFGASMTCFIPPRFTFMRVEDEKFVLYVGEPH